MLDCFVRSPNTKERIGDVLIEISNSLKRRLPQWPHSRS
jgi:hypothetical protein